MQYCIFCSTLLPANLICKCKIFEHTMFKNVRHFYNTIDSIKSNILELESANFDLILSFKLHENNMVTINLYAYESAYLSQIKHNINTLLNTMPKPISLEHNIIKDYIFNLNEQLNILNLFS